MIKNLINVSPPNHKHWNSRIAWVVWESNPLEAIKSELERNFMHIKIRVA